MGDEQDMGVYDKGAFCSVFSSGELSWACAELSEPNKLAQEFWGMAHGANLLLVESLSHNL